MIKPKSTLKPVIKWSGSKHLSCPAKSSIEAIAFLFTNNLNSGKYKQLLTRFNSPS